MVLTTAAIPGTLPAGDRRTFAAAPPSGDRAASACLASDTGERWLKVESGKKRGRFCGEFQHVSDRIVERKDCEMRAK